VAEKRTSAKYQTSLNEDNEILDINFLSK
jgi:hypothetical protein